MKNLVFNVHRFLFARQAFARFNSVLHQLSLRGLGILNYENRGVSGERHFIEKVLPSIVRREAPVFFDVGANVGAYSAELLRVFPGARIHAFEPHPLNYAALCRSVSSGAVRTHHLALGEAPETLHLYDRADKEGSSHASFYRRVITDLHKQEVLEVEVKVETLDRMADQQDVQQIDFLKVDTEGNELSVLKGASRLLEAGRIGCIQFEFGGTHLFSRVFLKDFRDLLGDFCLYRLLPGGMLPLGDDPLGTEIFAFQNIVALPRTSAGTSVMQTTGIDN